MAFTRRTRLGALIVVLALIVGVTVAGIVSGRQSSASEEAVAETPSSDAAAAPAPASAQQPRPTPADTNAPIAVDPKVQKQLAYVLAHWSDYNLDEYGQVGDNDCVNFASQSLIERGWKMDDDWWSDGTGSSFTFSKPWVSSTAFRDYLEDSGRASALTDQQRDQVKLGDIAQFDWDNSGDRDHTAVVTRIDHVDGGIQIYYGGHTDDTDYRSVDWAITVNHPGATAYYWSIP
ncbi:amidase domain-containing protein [Glaciibacter sp. 2TAF33]|uniref:amidase domain-containing protein n=1 Tax=Glaciibacter sp. 2TAF33 TaxID=3233015 RepID=UPI003F8F1746